MKYFGGFLAALAVTFSINASATTVDTASVVTEKTIGFASVAQGFYYADGSNFSTSLYIDEGNRNNYFVFDLSGVDLTGLKSASLVFDNAAGYTSTNQLVFKLFDVTHSIADLVSGDVSTDIYDDLQAGVEYASANASEFPEYANFELSFNQDGLNAIKTANGLFAFGGTLTSRTPNGDSELFFGAIHPGLVLTFSVTPVPEADTYVMFLAGLALMGLFSRKHTFNRKP
jgi:hypothetical protein